MGTTLISVIDAAFTVNSVEHEIENVSEAMVEDLILLDDTSERGGNVLGAVADVEVVRSRAITLMASTDLIAVKSATFDGTTIADASDVAQVSYEEFEVYVDDQVSGGLLLPSKDTIAVTARPRLTVITDNADEAFFDDGVVPGDTGSLIVTSARKGAADVTITASNMKCVGIEQVRLPGLRTTRVPVAMRFEPTHETGLTFSASEYVQSITAGTVGDLVLTVGVKRNAQSATTGTLTLTNMVARAFGRVTLPGKQSPRVPVGRRFTPTAESVLTFEVDVET